MMLGWKGVWCLLKKSCTMFIPKSFDFNFLHNFWWRLLVTIIIIVIGTLWSPIIYLDLAFLLAQTCMVVIFIHTCIIIYNLQNNVLELWSLFDFLMPGFLGTEKQFYERYGKPIIQSRDAKSSSKEQEAGLGKVSISHFCTLLSE